MAKKSVVTKKRNVKVDAIGQLHVHSSFNNIIVSLANGEGEVISWSSAGKMGFRGSKKNTPYAAQMAAEDCAKVAYDLGLRKVKAYVKGPGNGRESAIRSVHGAGIEVMEIIDVSLFRSVHKCKRLEVCQVASSSLLLNSRNRSGNCSLVQVRSPGVRIVSVERVYASTPFNCALLCLECSVSARLNCSVSSVCAERSSLVTCEDTDLVLATYPSDVQTAISVGSHRCAGAN